MSRAVERCLLLPVGPLYSSLRKKCIQILLPLLNGIFPPLFTYSRYQCLIRHIICRPHFIFSFVTKLPVLVVVLCGSAGKQSTSNAGDLSSIPGLGISAGEGTGYPLQYSWASLVAQMVKNPPAMRETWVRSLGQEDPLEKRKATQLQYSVLENCTDCILHWVAKRQTRLINFHFQFPFLCCKEHFFFL